LRIEQHFLTIISPKSEKKPLHLLKSML